MSARPPAVRGGRRSSSNRPLAVDAAGTGYASYRGQDDAVYLRTVRNGSWSAQTRLGGTIIGAPAATAPAATAPAATAAGGSTVVVAARGTDNALWVRTLSNGAWGPWRGWGGTMSASPAIAGASTGRIDAFSRGPNGALWTTTMLSSGVLTAWTGLGGQVITPPAAVSPAAGSIELYAVGTDHAVWRDALSGGVWSGWKPLGGATYSAPAAARIPGSNGVCVFARGTDNALYADTGNAGVFGSWRRLGGVLIDCPAAAGTPAPGIDVTVRGTDNAVWATSYRAGAWSGFTQAWAPADSAGPASSLLGTDWTGIPTTSKVVALTFDAGANAAGLPSIESALRARNVRATFFLTGTWVRDFPAQANLIVQDGFLAGNHSVTHPYFTQLTDAQVNAEVQGAQRAILRANGADTRPLFRFPYGDVNSRVLGDVNGLGYCRSAGPWTRSAGREPPAARPCRRSPTASWPRRSRARSCSSTWAPTLTTAPRWMPPPTRPSSPGSRPAAAASSPCKHSPAEHLSRRDLE